MIRFIHQDSKREPSRIPSAIISIPTFIQVFAALSTLILVLSASTLPALAASNIPTLKVSPKNVGIPGDGINCKGITSKGVSVCHVILAETARSGKPLHWSTGSDFPASFSPSNGYLTPGQSVKISITTSFCGGFTNFYFVGPKNVATVTFQCG